MKFRTFIMTLTLFLVFFYLGISVISVATFKDTVKHAKESGLGEHYFITSSVAKDFQAVESRGGDLAGSLDSLLQPYGYLSGDKTTNLVLYKDGRIVYNNRQDLPLSSRFAEPPRDGSRLVSMEKADGRTYVAVSGKLPSPYASYTLVYRSNATDSIASWKKTKNTLFLAGSLLSVLLSASLLLLLNRLFKPLSLISQTSRRIASGAYDTRLPVNGHDELAEMAQSFNHMAEEIQHQMGELTAAAEKKQQFIDNFAHELRTPLTAIYGYAE
ncbi:HAMP domain-containing protein [Gorillibacterium massiliense]|uniref:HAMP domain-containing protein n=1 Tax=Gorillibacterium massiliense TaxID=1280390 RepID=UPI0004BA8416|nr:HAMP domain-containing protein [Gorillibacterium massiliense]